MYEIAGAEGETNVGGRTMRPLHSYAPLVSHCVRRSLSVGVEGRLNRRLKKERIKEYSGWENLKRSIRECRQSTPLPYSFFCMYQFDMCT